MIRPALGLARALWRTLPMDVRRVVGGRMVRAAEPFLARRLPKADPRLAKRAADAALLVGLFRGALGHSRAAVLLERELCAAGIATGLRDITGDVGAALASDARHADRAAPDDAPAILVVNPDTAIVALAGAEDVLSGRRVIGYFVYELEQAPKRWARLNGVVHEVWTPSTFSKAALAPLFDCPVHVVPHPAALDPPAPASPDLKAAARARLGLPENDFVAVSSFSATSSLARKNPEGAVTAFEQAFGARRDVHLVLRCLGEERYPAAVAALRRRIAGSGAQVRLLVPPGGLATMQDLLAAADVYLSLHRSEGFGLNLAEAMLAGVPVIATGWSGNLDFMDAAAARLVPARLAPVRDPQGIYDLPGARWAEPDAEAAAAALVALEASDALRAQIGQAGRRHAANRLNGGAAARRLRVETGSTNERLMDGG